MGRRDHPESSLLGLVYNLSLQGEEDDGVRKYNEALRELRADGVMGNLDGEDEQKIVDLLPVNYFDLIISFHPSAEYTSNIRHQETGKALINLWHSGKISAGELWTITSEETAGIYRLLSRRILRKKKSILTEIYGFDQSNFETETMVLAESFFPFTSSFEARKLLR